MRIVIASFSTIQRRLAGGFARKAAPKTPIAFYAGWRIVVRETASELPGRAAINENE
jgi:hypothetical protein